MWLECSSNHNGCLCGVRAHSAAVWIFHVVVQRRLSRPSPVKGMPCRSVWSLVVKAREMSRMERVKSASSCCPRSTRVRVQLEIAFNQVEGMSPGNSNCSMPYCLSIVFRCSLGARCSVEDRRKKKAGRQAIPDEERLPCFSTNQYMQVEMGLPLLVTRRSCHGT